MESIHKRHTVTFAQVATHALLALAVNACAPVVAGKTDGPASRRCAPPGDVLSVLTLQSLVAGPASRATPAGGPGPFVRLVQPTQVAARGNDVIIADAGLARLLRVDRALGTFSTFQELPAAQVTGLYVDQGRNVYVADSASRTVMQFTLDGQLLRRFTQPQSLVQPIDVAAPEGTARVFVADGLLAHLVVFLPLGTVAQVIGERAREPYRFLSIIAVAFGPDGLYLLDRVGQQVHVVAPAGAYLYSIGKDALGLPVALAVDRFNRVFVADQSDNSIKMFAPGRNYPQRLQPAASAFRFRRVTDLWVDEPGLLYAADASGARVDILLVPPPCPS